MEILLNRIMYDWREISSNKYYQTQQTITALTSLQIQWFILEYDLSFSDEESQTNTIIYNKMTKIWSVGRMDNYFLFVVEAMLSKSWTKGRICLSLSKWKLCLFLELTQREFWQFTSFMFINRLKESVLYFRQHKESKYVLVILHFYQSVFCPINEKYLANYWQLTPIKRSNSKKREVPTSLFGNFRRYFWRDVVLCDKGQSPRDWLKYINI